MKKLVCGYVAIGALIGLVCGLTDSPVAAPLVAALFAFIGGGITYLVSRNEDLDKYGCILIAFCAPCFVCLLLGVFIKLNSSSVQFPGNRDKPQPSPLKGAEIKANEFESIRDDLQKKQLTEKQALLKLLDLFAAKAPK